LIDRGRHNLLGVNLHAIDYETAVTRIVAAAKQHRPLSVCALPVHGVMTGALDHRHRYRLNHFDLAVPDGQPVRWGLNLLHRTALSDRVYGPELMLRVCAQAARDGLPIYLFGSRESVLEQLERRLAARFPGLIVAGRSIGRFASNTEAQNKQMIRDIRGSGTRLVFVAIGCPRQEVWAYENVEALSCPVLAVGAAFDFHAGTVPQAPPWMQRRGLEWLFRLRQEPRRLWKRYALLNPLFVSLLLLQWLRIYHPERRPGQPPDHPERYG